MIANFLCIYLVTIIRFVILLTYTSAKKNEYLPFVNQSVQGSHSKYSLQDIQNIQNPNESLIRLNSIGCLKKMRYLYWLFAIHFQIHDPKEICYEKIEDYKDLINKVKYISEGITLLVVGLFGLLGNFLSIIVLKRSRRNKGFNTLLIM